MIRNDRPNTTHPQTEETTMPVIRSPARRVPHAQKRNPMRGCPLCCHHTLALARPVQRPERVAKTNAVVTTCLELEPTRTYSNLKVQARHLSAPAKPLLRDNYSVAVPRYSVLVRFTPLFAGRSLSRNAPNGIAEVVSRLNSRVTLLQVRLTPSCMAKHTELWG